MAFLKRERTLIGHMILREWMVKYPLQKLQKEILGPHSCALMGMGFWKALAGFLRSDLVLHPGNENSR